MEPAQIDDPVEIEAFLRRDVFLNIYAIGDLDDFFRPFTTWYALRDGAGTAGRGVPRDRTAAGPDVRGVPLRSPAAACAPVECDPAIPSTPDHPLRIRRSP
jgi:hypothetical protein